MSRKTYYEVDKIVDHREGNKGIEFLVRWEHYKPESDSWEPAENLKNCNDIIDTYFDKMDSDNKRKIRRSARLSQVHQLDSSQAKSEVSMSKSRRKSREPAVTRSTRSTKTKTNTKGKSGKTTIMEESSTVQRYSTRSSARQIDMSDDEGDVLLSSTKPLTGRKPLSESNFRKNIDGLFSSTPYALEKEGSKKSHGYEKFSQEKVTVTTQVTGSEENMMGEADSDDDEVTKGTQRKLEKEASCKVPPTPVDDETPSWMEIGWKEVALATVLTGIGVLGYVCYVTDYCSYC